GADVQGRLMEIDDKEDDYDYYESQAARYDRIKARAKPFGTLPEQDLDDNVATPDNMVVYDKKKNAVYSFDGYTIAKGFGDSELQQRRKWKKTYYTNVNNLERIALEVKLKASGIKDDPYMNQQSISKPRKV
ncbi:MAG: hypothetical protein EZS28_038117, partial [Streblomastix strix]